MSSHVHDRALLDRLESIEPTIFRGDVWRIVSSGRNPVIGSTAKGRWSEQGGPEILYTSLEKNGAIAEIGFRLSLEPVWPSKLRHDVYRLAATTNKTLRFVNLEALAAFGVEQGRYHLFDYDKTQEIAAAAYFLEYDGIQAPNARYPCDNLMIFSSHADPVQVQGAPESVDWTAWRASRRN